jgi:integrase
LQDYFPVEAMMHPNDDFLSAPELDYDDFRNAMREDWGWFTPARETNIFASKVRTRRVLGFAAVDLTCNATRLERTELDIRPDDMEYYCVTAQATATRQYARLLSDWLASVGLDPHLFGTRSLRRTKATLIYRRTGNLRAVQLLLGHTKIESTARCLGIEVDDALAIAEQVDV